VGVGLEIILLTSNDVICSGIVRGIISYFFSFFWYLPHPSDFLLSIPVDVTRGNTLAPFCFVLVAGD